MEVPTVLTPTRTQIAEQIVDTLVPRGRDRRLQGSLPAKSSTTSLSSGKRMSERIMEQIVDFPEQTVEQIVNTSPSGGLAQGSASSAGPADEDFDEVFRTFPHGKKSARAAASPSAELPREVSSWTPAAYVAPMPDSIEWVELSDASGRTYFWNRRSQATVWKTPPGVQIVWVGVKDGVGGTWYWHRRTRATGYSLPPPPE